MERLSLVLRFAAPYLAVAVGWFWLSNAWLAVILYHLQILLWLRGGVPRPRRPLRRVYLLLALAGLAAGPLLYVLLPAISQGGLSEWMAERHLSRDAILWLLPYFGFVHPWLEQLHWQPLREQGAWAHLLFAGYHVWVLIALASWPWLVFVFLLLAAVSWLWRTLTACAGNLIPAYLSHALADIGIVVAVCLRM